MCGIVIWACMHNFKLTSVVNFKRSFVIKLPRMRFYTSFDKMKHSIILGVVYIRRMNIVWHRIFVKLSEPWNMPWRHFCFTSYLTIYMEHSLFREADSRLVRQEPPASYGNKSFITLFTRAGHCSLSWDRWSQSTLPWPISLKSILIL